jgi:hypothetical protein
MQVNTRYFLILVFDKESPNIDNLSLILISTPKKSYQQPRYLTESKLYLKSQILTLYCRSKLGFYFLVYNSDTL